MSLDKRQLLQQLRGHYVQRLAVATRAESDAREAARSVATESEKKEDARVALEFGSLATGQGQRTLAVRAEIEHIDTLLGRKLPLFGPTSPVALLALVDVVMSTETGQRDERTFFVLPLGAGTELAGPGGDGFLSVITPASPVGKALMGRRAGEVADVQLKDGLCELEILEVG